MAEAGGLQAQVSTSHVMAGAGAQGHAVSKATVSGNLDEEGLRGRRRQEAASATRRKEPGAQGAAGQCQPLQTEAKGAWAARGQEEQGQEDSGRSRGLGTRAEGSTRQQEPRSNTNQRRQEPGRASAKPESPAGVRRSRAREKPRSLGSEREQEPPGGGGCVAVNSGREPDPGQSWNQSAAEPTVRQTPLRRESRGCGSLM